MKMLVVLALSAFVAAEPEADPALLYTSAYGAYPYAAHAGVYGYPYGAPVAYGAPLTYTNVAAVKTVEPVEVKEAEPAVVATYNAVNPVVYSAAVHHAVAAPVTYTTAVHHAVAAPAVTYAAAPVVAAPVATHTITNYNNPEQYTATSNGLFGPSYIAKNGPVEHIVKREADAEADPALIYSAAYGAYPYAHAYGAYPYAAYAHHAVAAPVTYAHHAVAAPVTYANHAVVAPAVGLAKTPDHAVAYTAYGVTHSSNVGVCTNVAGVQVPC
jgi:hypothetical protein